MGDKRPHDDEREGRLLKLVQSVLMRPEADRESFLREQVGDDEALRNSVLEMLADFEQTESFLKESPLERISLSEAPDGDVTGAWSAFLDRIGQARTVWERFQDQGEIARGGMGAIHKVRDEDLRRTLAMKLMLSHGGPADPARPAQTDASLGRFLEEAQITSQLDHPGIVPVHEIGVDDQARVYFTMKLVKGDDLRTAFDRVRDPADSSWNTTRALSTLLRVCEAMAYAHAKGVIHRDLKPANVMVGAYGETCVMDWGIARIMGCEDHKDLRLQPAPASTLVKSERRDAAHATPDSPLVTTDGDVVGTPAFMSPEQACGRIEEMGPHSDVYAVGAMLYQLLTGQMPYVKPRDRVSPYTLLARVQQGPPQPIHQLNQDVPAELIAICDKAMARAIPDRYSDMTELANDLRAYLENRVVAAYESGALAELKKWIARNKGIATTAGASVILLAALTVWFVVRVRTEEQAAHEYEAQETARKAEFDQLAGVVLLEDALAAEQDLYPSWPEKIKAMENWLAFDVSRLLALKPTLEKTLFDLEQRALPPESTDHEPAQAEVEAGAPRREEWRFTSESQLFLHTTLRDLSDRLTAFEQNEKQQLEQRLDWARRIGQLSLHHPNAISTWEEARAAIASADGVRASELYRQHPIDLKHQMGLVPIGMNPVTRLWEFYHLRSAWDSASGQDPAEIPIPEHAGDGSIEVRDGTGIVFVLIPGGTFQMGTQYSDPEAPNFSAKKQWGEEPVHEMTLDAYFLARHELTVGQWFRLTNGDEPSYLTRGEARAVDPVLFGWRHPVNQVAWNDCARVLSRHGLVLPTEAQWEYAARAGTTSTWWTGSEATSLAGAANLKDLSVLAVRPDIGIPEGEFNDGFINTSPVGSFRANPFGLFDVHGNLWEWCRDQALGYDVSARDGDGLRVGHGPDSSFRVYRGGSIMEAASYARSATRALGPPSHLSQFLGLRPAQSLRH